MDDRRVHWLCHPLQDLPEEDLCGLLLQHVQGADAESREEKVVQVSE